MTMEKEGRVEVYACSILEMMPSSNVMAISSGLLQRRVNAYKSNWMRFLESCKNDGAKVR
jgi:hypothetical protein